MPTARKFIQIDDLQIINNNILMFKLSFSREIKKYFSSNSFYVKYDKKIKKVGKDILNIPAVASVITLAWTVNADVYVDHLDKTYLESLNIIKNVLNSFYPNINFDSKIHVDDIILNGFNKDEYGLLYSGGIDSISSYIINKNKKPNLITIIGSMFSVNKDKFIMKIKNMHKQFTEKENVSINFIESNIRNVLNEGYIDSIFGKYIRYETW